MPWQQGARSHARRAGAEARPPSRPPPPPAFLRPTRTVRPGPGESPRLQRARGLPAPPGPAPESDPPRPAPEPGRGGRGPGGEDGVGPAERAPEAELLVSPRGRTCETGKRSRAGPDASGSSGPRWGHRFRPKRRRLSCRHGGSDCLSQKDKGGQGEEKGLGVGGGGTRRAWSCWSRSLVLSRRFCSTALCRSLRPAARVCGRGCGLDISGIPD